MLAMKVAGQSQWAQEDSVVQLVHLAAQLSRIAVLNALHMGTSDSSDSSNLAGMLGRHYEA